MRITDWEIKESSGATEVSAVVDGFRLWYRIPGSYPVSRAADPFVAAALLPAMLQGQKLEISSGLSLSRKLLENIQLLQEIHHCWNPILKIIPIETKTSTSPPLHNGAMSFYSGGVDSAYTFLERQREITHLVLIQGFDFFVKCGRSGTFSAEDLSDLSQLAFKLMTADDAVSAFLKARLSKKTVDGLSRYLNTGEVTEGLEVGLAEDIVHLIVGSPLWNKRVFAGVPLRPETKDLLKTSPRGEEMIRLNRLLLEDAYPLEIARSRSEIYEKAIDRNAKFAESFGKTLIPISTNHFAFGYRYNLSRSLTQGSALASVAHLLGFSRVYVPASYSYDQLTPLGSHPLTDPLWSNESVQFIHDGAEARRVAKLGKIVENGATLANLRVCFSDMNANCGRCSKCMRTMIALTLLEAPDSPFPPLPSPRALSKMRIASEVERIFFEENMDVVRGAAQTKLRSALRTVLRRYRRRHLLDDIDTILLGGLIKQAHRRLFRSAKSNIRIDTTLPGV